MIGEFNQQTGFVMKQRLHLKNKMFTSADPWPAVAVSNLTPCELAAKCCQTATRRAPTFSLEPYTINNEPHICANPGFLIYYVKRATQFRIGRLINSRRPAWLFN